MYLQFNHFEPEGTACSSLSKTDESTQDNTQEYGLHKMGESHI